ncbi:DUF305 domain-containing protein [Paraburkholderia sp. MMS20-SJTN17]|uniref:DUF305 domain-containing protein n=1 Tax=Paraburkholderia translucens TaxID=2886945 RepID=A0ABS8KGN9_9BURK|nr:DUF305 domain-containing protein [Paraburkholderia sp. MMS20-SJTN17]MCC8403925.1 DUF305 domain-containing protein [Paraburkholderia sp. MMS20-SJTN17]
MRILSVARSSFVCAGVVLGLAALPAAAQQSSSMPGMKMSAQDGAGASASTQAYQDADEKMMHNMSAPPYTGDADKDFVAHMIPHHQGAIEMAKVQLKYGKDPELKKLAKSIINAQHDEIGFMQRWQQKHGGK